MEIYIGVGLVALVIAIWLILRPSRAVRIDRQGQYAAQLETANDNYSGQYEAEAAREHAKLESMLKS
jgi:hypothetical protein